MTNLEKWVADNILNTSTENKINLICEHYRDCNDCPLNNSKSCFTVADAEKWLNAESEVEK